MKINSKSVPFGNVSVPFDLSFSSISTLSVVTTVFSRKVVSVDCSVVWFGVVLAGVAFIGCVSLFSVVATFLKTKNQKSKK